MENLKALTLDSRLKPFDIFSNKNKRKLNTKADIQQSVDSMKNMKLLMLANYNHQGQLQNHASEGGLTLFKSILNIPKKKLSTLTIAILVCILYILYIILLMSAPMTLF